MRILDETQPLQFAVSPGTVYVSTNPDHSSYANLTVTVTNISGDAVSVNNFAITLPSYLAPTATLGSITPITNSSSIWIFGPSDVNPGEFDATSQSGNDVPMQSTDIWQFTLQLVTLNSSATLPSSAEVTVAVTYGDASTYSQPLTVDIDAATQSIISFNSIPSAIGPGEDATLQWQCTEIDYCELSPGDGLHLDASGSENMSPQETTIYTLYAYADSVILSAQWAISVENPQIIKFGGQAGQTNLNLGDSITLVWECNQYTNSIKLTASDLTIPIPDLLTNGNTVTQGSVLLGPIVEPTTFTFTAYGSNTQNFNESSALIQVNNVTATLTATPDSDIWEKDNVTLTWSVESASAITIDPPLLNGPSLQNPSGSVIINPMSDITYTITAQGFINNLPNPALAGLSLNVSQVQLSSFTITPEQITPDQGGNTATLGWVAQAQVLTIDNGIGDVSNTSSYPLDAPVDGTVYNLSAGTIQNPGTANLSVTVINSFGPYTISAFNDDTYYQCIQDVIIANPNEMQYLNQGVNGGYSVTLNGLTVTSTPADGTLAVMVNYADDDASQSCFWLLYWPIQPNNRVTLAWADPNNPTGTITLTGTVQESEATKSRYRAVFLKDGSDPLFLKKGK